MTLFYVTLLTTHKHEKSCTLHACSDVYNYVVESLNLVLHVLALLVHYF